MWLLCRPPVPPCPPPTSLCAAVPRLTGVAAWCIGGVRGRVTTRVLLLREGAVAWWHGCCLGSEVITHVAPSLDTPFWCS